jgi:hypothetical protein
MCVIMKKLGVCKGAAGCQRTCWTCVCFCVVLQAGWAFDSALLLALYSSLCVHQCSTVCGHCALRVGQRGPVALLVVLGVSQPARA